MGNCLKTQLKGNVQNPDLEVIGTFRLGVSPTESSELYINPSSGQSIRVTTSDGLSHIKKNAGDSYAPSLDFSHANSYWDNHIICEPGTYKIILTNKYNLENLYCTKVELNLDDLAYSNISSIEFYGNTLSGSKINKDSLTTLYIRGGEFDIANIADATSLQRIRFEKGVYGDLDVLNTITTLSMQDVVFNNSSVYGDIAALNNVANLRSVGFLVDDLSTHTEQITGDLSSLLATVKTVNLINKPSNFTWSGERSHSAFALCLKGAVLGEYVDAMLKNQAQCDLANPQSVYDKTIDVYGTHNPEDADAVSAIATIKAAGWTVIINGVTM